MKIAYRIYDTLSAMAAVGATAAGIRRRPGNRRGEWIRERFGMVDYGPRDIWLHAVSVGESVAALPLVTELLRRNGDWRLLFTTVTETGRAVAVKHLGKEVVATVPWDVGPVVGRVLDQTKPKAVITLETEIWPAFIHAAKERTLPFLVVNGRISDKSFARYRKARPVMGPVFKNVTGFGMQTEEDASRVLELGAKAESIVVLGNLKYDVPPPGDQPPEWMRGVSGKIWVVGSTHKGEDEIVLDALKVARECVRNLKLVIAPRHPERFEAVARLVETRGFSLARRSLLGDVAHQKIEADVILLDVMGELSRTYGGAEVCFVGGSLVPSGGHNILEAVTWRRPVIVGPYMDNFAEMERLFDGAGGLARARDAAELGAVVADLVNDPVRTAGLVARASAILEQHKGAAVRAADWIESHVVKGTGSA